MFSVSIIGMFVYKEVTSNDTIISSASMETFLMYLENVVEFLALFKRITNNHSLPQVQQLMQATDIE